MEIQAGKKVVNEMEAKPETLDPKPWDDPGISRAVRVVNVAALRGAIVQSQIPGIFGSFLK